MAIEWSMAEPGWYTSKRGGIVRENGGWWFFPIDDEAQKYGPFRSLAAAKIAARRGPEDAPAFRQGDRQ